MKILRSDLGLKPRKPAKRNVQARPKTSEARAKVAARVTARNGGAR